MSNRQPLVSVIIPTLGRGSLGRAVSSVQAQTHSQIETIIVVDDTNEFDRVAKTHGAPGVQVVSTSGRQGGAVARNIGCAASTGEMIAYLDDDDWWDPAKLHLQLRSVSKLSRKTDHIVVSCISWFHPTSGKPRKLPHRLPDQHDIAHVGDYLLSRRRLRYGDGYIPTPSLLMDRGLALEEPWDIRWKKHQDWDLLIRLLSRGDVSFELVAQPLVHITQGSPGSVSRMADWSASLEWLTAHARDLGPRSTSDFLWAVPLRAAVSARDFAEALRILRLTRALPHSGAAGVVVAALLGLKS